MSRGRIQICAVSVAALLIVPGCSPDESIVVESKGPHHMVARYRQDEPPLVDPYRLEPAGAYGMDQSEDGYLLQSAAPIGIAEDGSVLVRDYRAKQIHRFAAHGEHIGSFGGEGSGPGEFQVLNPPMFDGVAIYCLDPLIERLTVYHWKGLLLETIPLDEGQFPGSQFSVFGFPGTYGYASIRNEVTRDPETRIPRYQEFEITLLNSKLKETAHPVQIRRDRPWQALNGDLSLTVIPPFRKLTAVVAVAPDRPIAWSFGDEFAFSTFDPENGRRWDVMLESHPAVPVTREMKEQYLEQTWGSRNLIQEARREVEFPDHLPVIDAMLWDSDGRLWIKEHPVPDQQIGLHRFQVFTDYGEWLFQQSLPVEPYRIESRRVFTVDTNESGNPVVRAYSMYEGP